MGKTVNQTLFYNQAAAKTKGPPEKNKGPRSV